MVTLDGAPWFVAKDVCDVLGLKNPTQALYKVEPCEKQTRTLTPNEGGIGRALINKDGLYRLAMRSDKKVARDFQSWIIKVVLPAIEKDGGYVLGEEKVATGELSEDELVLKVMQMQAAKVERLKAERDAALKAQSLAEQSEKLARYLETSKSVTSRSSGSPARASQDT